MGRTRKMLGLGALAGLVIPPIAAAIAKGRLEPEGDALSDEIKVVTIFDGERFASRASSFRGGSILAWYAGTDVDLRSARLDPAGATLRVTTMFGGVSIRVPQGWDVDIRHVLPSFFGGVDDDTDEIVGGGATLVVETIAVFGGIRVTTRPPDEDDADELLPPPNAGEGDLARAEIEAEALATSEVTGTDAGEGSLEVDGPADETPAG
jgi:hypothetical protein